MAKRNYEALNHQLIEELPHFIQLALRIINHTVTVLFQLQFRFHTAVHAILEQLADQYGPRTEERSLVTSDTIQGSLSQSLSCMTLRPRTGQSCQSQWGSHDRIGCSEWWLVEGLQGTGYIPANFLHYHHYQHT